MTRVGPGDDPDDSASASPQDGGVAPRHVQLRVDVTVDGPTITGQVAAAGLDRPFSGRLGLMVAIEQALGPTDEPDQRAAPG